MMEMRMIVGPNMLTLYHIIVGGRRVTAGHGMIRLDYSDIQHSCDIVTGIHRLQGLSYMPRILGEGGGSEFRQAHVK